MADSSNNSQQQEETPPPTDSLTTSQVDGPLGPPLPGWALERIPKTYTDIPHSHWLEIFYAARERLGRAGIGLQPHHRWPVSYSSEDDEDSEQEDIPTFTPSNVRPWNVAYDRNSMTTRFPSSLSIHVFPENQEQENSKFLNMLDSMNIERQPSEFEDSYGADPTILSDNVHSIITQCRSLREVEAADWNLRHVMPQLDPILKRPVLSGIEVLDTIVKTWKSSLELTAPGQKLELHGPEPPIRYFLKSLINPPLLEEHTRPHTTRPDPIGLSWLLTIIYIMEFCCSVRSKRMISDNMPLVIYNPDTTRNRRHQRDSSSDLEPRNVIPKYSTPRNVNPKYSTLRDMMLEGILDDEAWLNMRLNLELRLLNHALHTSRSRTDDDPCRCDECNSSS